MRPSHAIAGLALIAWHATANAGPARACAEVSGRVDEAVQTLLANLPEPHPDAARARARLRDCLTSRNICSVVYSARDGTAGLVAADTTADLPAQGLEQGGSSVILLLRSIPRVGNDSNRYCLVSEKVSTTAVHHWSVYGWVIPPNASEALPLPRQVLDENATSDPRTLRSLAAALWFFAEGMSGHPPPNQEGSEESADTAWLAPSQAIGATALTVSAPRSGRPGPCRRSDGALLYGG